MTGKRRLQPWHNQRGDTIIEVLIAITILSTVLFSAYGLANQTAKLGLSAREQDQATQLLQHQAEGLRYMRDNAASWQDFADAVDQYNEFYVRLNSNTDEWEVESGRGNGSSILDNSFSLFTTWSEVVSTGGESNRREITTHVEWETVQGRMQTSTTDIVLVNTDSLAPPPPLDPNVTCNNLNANPDRGTKPLDVNFRVNYDVEDTSVTHFEWDFDDGRGRTTTSNRTNHTYRNQGTYIASVRIHTRDGAKDSCNTRVRVVSGSRTFTYVGRRVQYYRVPANVHEIRVDAYGAQGGHASGRSYGGGKGGHVRTHISVRPGQRLKIYVGGQGGPPSSRARASGGDGGWPYGGDGGDGGATTGSGAGGGGSSEVRALNNRRLVVAAGGGGSTRWSCSNGGDGHSRPGESSRSSRGYGTARGGGGGTARSGGNGGSSGGQDGRWKYGGDGGTTSGGGGGGGGGGYYGGGGGGSRPYTCAAAGGGGGSYSFGSRTRLRVGIKRDNGRITITPQ